MSRELPYRTPRGPPQSGVWRENWRERDRGSGQAALDLTGSPNHGDLSKVSPGLSGANITTPDHGKLKMPKNFDRPLTCFYWYTYGNCTKAEDDCLYAHYNTGTVASPPFAIGAEQGAIAGRNAMKRLDEHTKKEQELKEKEAWLTAKEMEINGKLGSQQAIDEVVRGVHEVIDDTKSVLLEALDTLNRQYAAMVDIDKGTQTQGSGAIDAAAASISDLYERINEVGNRAEHQLGRSTLSEPVRIYLDVGQP